MTWYKKVLAENRKEIITSAIVSIVITLAFSVWYFITGKGFEWRAISPISQPSLLHRYFYSAFVFVTIGAFLYHIVKLWKILHFIFVEILGIWKLYKLVKWILWMSLILSTYYYIMPTVVSVLNAVISFFYNITILLLYLTPPVGIFLIVFSLSYAIYIVVKEKFILSKIDKKE